MKRDDLIGIAGVDYYDICNQSNVLLSQRGWNVTASGIKKNMDIWLRDKTPKIMDMVKNPYYNGNLQLVYPTTIIRKANLHRARLLLSNMIAIAARGDNVKLVIGLVEIISNLSVRISQISADKLNEILGLDKKKIVAGQKTSKVVKRILELDGYQKYHSEFVEFSDYINEKEQPGCYVVSLNFIDYLRMSDGHSWSTCMTTDPRNTRRLKERYNGQHVQGCLSYANDHVTYITYFITEDPDKVKPEQQDKIYRQCMHVRKDKLMYINGRVYPKGNDGEADIYDTMNSLFQKVMGFENFKEVGISKECAYVTTDGNHYPDYYSILQCKMYSVEGNTDNSITIGHKAYSCKTGKLLEKGDLII